MASSCRGASASGSWGRTVKLRSALIVPTVVRAGTPPAGGKKVVGRVLVARIVIDDVRPRTPTGRYPAKAVIGEAVTVAATVFKDGHDPLAARVRWRPVDKQTWGEAPLSDVGNDRWEGTIEPTTLGAHEIVVEAWTDTYATWQHKLTAKLAAGQDVDVELEEGARFLEARAKKLGATTTGC